MKILVCGCGGVGSWLIEELARQIEQGQVEFTEPISIADFDTVELEQLKYQNFGVNEVGENKAKALAKRCKALGVDVFEPIPKRIERENQLKPYDLFILCVDNDKTRKFVIEYCHENGKSFIDLRATGRKVFAMPKLTLKENLKFIDGNGEEEEEGYSCQEEADLERGHIQVGNKVVAMIGTQMLLNHQRHIPNRAINLVI